MEETPARKSKWFRKTALMIYTAVSSLSTTVQSSTPSISILTILDVDLRKESNVSSVSSAAVLVVHLFCRASVKVVHPHIAAGTARFSFFHMKDYETTPLRLQSVTSKRHN